MLTPPNSALEIVPLQPSDVPWLKEYWTQRWGDAFVVSRGRIHRAEGLPGFIARLDGEIAGVATYHIENERLSSSLAATACELVSIDSLVEKRGVGSALIDTVKQVAIEHGCRRLWLITTNDNLPALAFYQKRGFRLVAVHAGAMSQTRRLKPAVPLTGLDGIPLRDEIELEYPLAPRLPAATYPSPDGCSAAWGEGSRLHPSPEGGGHRCCRQQWGEGIERKLGLNPHLSTSGPLTRDGTVTAGNSGVRESAGTRLSRRPIYESRWVNLYLDHMRTPSGLEIPDFHIVDFPNAAVAAYVTNAQGEILCGQYYRYTIGKVCWEIPAGGIEPGEDILTAARREVLEETGYDSYGYTHYYSYFPSSGSTNKLFHVARGFAGPQSGPHNPHELAQVAWLSPAQLRQMIRDGELDDGYTLTALLLAWELGL